MRSLAGAFSAVAFGAASLELVERGFDAEFRLLLFDLAPDPDLPVCGFPDPEPSFLVS